MQNFPGNQTGKWAIYHDQIEEEGQKIDDWDEEKR